MQNLSFFFFFFQAEDGIRDLYVTGVQTCALPISGHGPPSTARQRARRLHLSVDGEFRHVVAPALLRLARRSRRRLRIRGDARRGCFADDRRDGSRAGAAGSGLQGRHRAAPCLVAARASGGAQPCLRAHERSDDQGRGVRVHPHRVRLGGAAGLVVGRGGAALRRRQRDSRRAPRLDGARSQAPPRISHRRKHRHHLHRPRARPRLPRQRHARAGGVGTDRGALSRLQPFGVQEPALLRRRQRPRRNGPTRHGTSGRTCSRHAVHGFRVPHRLGGDLGTPSVQRVCLRMAHLPGDSAESAAAAVGAQVSGTGDRCAARAFRGAGRGLLREGVRDYVPRTPQNSRRRRGARGRSLFARRDVRAGRPVPRRGNPGELLHRRARPRGPDARGGSAGAANGNQVADDRSHRREPQLVQRTAPVRADCRCRVARCLHHPPLGVPRDAAFRALGLRLPRCKRGDAIHRGQFRAAHPARVRDSRVSCARGNLYAGTRGYATRADAGPSARPPLGCPVFTCRQKRRLHRRCAQSCPVPHDPRLPDAGFRCAGRAARGARHMAMILDALVRVGQVLLVLLLAPLLTGYVRKVKAHLLRRRGPPIIQPYRDLLKLLRKEAVLADNASWVFRVAPYVIFATTWVAAALVPTFATGLVFSAAVDLIAIVALLGSARFMLALAGLDVGTSFGGMGSSREMMIASLAEPAMLMIAFTLSLLAGSTQLSSVAAFMQGTGVGLRASLAMALVALVMVAIAENARIPVDNPATHLELTMVHEAMILEYSGRHLAVIELAGSLKLLLYLSLIGCVFAPWGVAVAGQDVIAYAGSLVVYVIKLAIGGLMLAVFETVIAKMRVFRASDFLGAALMLGLLAALLLFVS